MKWVYDSELKVANEFIPTTPVAATTEWYYTVGVVGGWMPDFYSFRCSQYRHTNVKTCTIPSLPLAARESFSEIIPNLYFTKR